MLSVERLSNDEQPEIDPNLGHEANQVGGNEEEVRQGYSRVIKLLTGPENEENRKNQSED